MEGLQVRDVPATALFQVCTPMSTVKGETAVCSRLINSARQGGYITGPAFSLTEEEIETQRH